jgi:hypothetical protein
LVLKSILPMNLLTNMTTIKSYIPILRLRPAEMKALEKLLPQDRENITPLVELVMPGPSLNRKDDKKIITKTPKEKFLEALPEVADNILTSCGQNSIFIDVHLLDADIRASSFEQILSSSLRLDIFSIPVTYIIPVTSTSADSATRAIAVNFAKSSGHGLCIRIDKSHLEDQHFSEHLTDFIKTNGLSIENIDLLVDLRIINQGTDAKDVAEKLEKLPDIKKWRSFIVSGGVFPKDLTDYTPGEVHALNRFDWKLWSDLHETKLPRLPSFSDYTIQHPFYEYVAAIGSASVRYTADDKWWIFRGKIPGHINRKTKEKGPGREQYIGHARTLVNRDFYKKSDYCFGDAEIARIADVNNTKPGSPPIWLTIGINHHITLVARQLANFVAKIGERPKQIS